MLRSKAIVFGVLGLLVLMTGIFTATSSDSLGSSQTAGAGSGDLVLVNGDGISGFEFTSRVATVEQNLVTLQAQAESLEEEDERVNAYLETMESTPPETVALASLILDFVTYQEAVGRGFQPDAEQVDAQIEQQRETVEMIEENPEQFGVNEEEVEQFREYIDTIGEDRYWNEYYPRVIEQQLAVQQLQSAVADAGDDWLETQRELFHDADVQVQDQDAIEPATVSAAGEYLDEIWSLTQS